MDPLTTAAVIAVGGQVAHDYAVGKLLDTLGGKVVGYWSDWRAKQFGSAFLASLAIDDATDMQAKIDEFAADPRKSAALFDAYRRVALSASPTLGPRIIALVMGRVVTEDRQPTADEEMVLTAARELNDSELIAARDDWTRLNGLERKKHGRYQEGSGDFEYCEYFELENGGSPCYEYWLLQGPWAGKLHSLSFMWTVERIAPPTRPNDHVTEPTLVSDLYWATAYELLANLTTRAEALGPAA